MGMVQRIRTPYLIGDGVYGLELGCGHTTLIDECDVERVTVCNWHSSTNGRDQSRYVKGRPYSRKGSQGRLERLHRFILGVTDANLQIDHINRDTLDNRRCNLRIVTQSENMRNTRKKSPHRTSARLSVSDVERIRLLGYLPARQVAEVFECSVAYVHMLRSGKARQLEATQ